MTTLYRPVLIESAEQAEALAYGTVARRDVGSRIEVMVKHAPWTWWVGGEQFLRVGPEVAVGFEALVPIEAEEEWTAMGSDNGEPWIAHVGHDGIDGSREEAQQYVDRFGGFIAHRTRTPWEEA